MRVILAVVFTLSLAACATTSSVDPTTGDLRTQPAVVVPPDNDISAETLVGAGAIAAFGLPSTAFGLTAPVYSSTNAAVLYIIYDPLAPNWTIKEQALSEDTFHLALRAKSFRTGGDGEAIQIVKRRARQLQRLKGYADYRILDYSEGIESSTPLTHRVSEGTIQLVKTQIPVGQ